MKTLEEKKEEAKKRSVAWRIANPERRDATNKAYYQKHKAIIAEKQNAYKLTRLDDYKAYQSEYKKKNRERFKDRNRIDAHNRRESKVGKLSKDITVRLMELQRGRCPVCKVSLKSVKTHIDHIMPLYRGGLNVDSNVQLLCDKCNLHKHAKHPVDFMQSKGFLL